MLEFKNVTKTYNGSIVFENFSLEFPERGTVAVLGPSGCGKTTLLRLIAGLEKPDSGTVTIPENSKISMMFQEDRLLDALDVRGNVLAVLAGRDVLAGRAPLSGSEADRRLADMCLARCGLSDAADKRIPELSGGMRRRVAIARAMAFRGDILLLDEPFKGLDEETKRMVSDFVFEDGGSRLTVFITHDRDEIPPDCKQALQFAGPPMQIVAGK